MAYKIEMYVGDKTTAAKLDRMAINLLDFSSAFANIGQSFREQIETQFANRGFLPGVSGPWKPLDPTTITAKGSDKPLIRYDNLKWSYTHTYNPFNIHDSGKQRAKFGTFFRGRNGNNKFVPIAIYHQMGTRSKFGRVHVPARPITLGNNVLDEQIVDAIVDRIFEGTF